MEVSIAARHGTLAADAHDDIERTILKLSHLCNRIDTKRAAVGLRSGSPVSNAAMGTTEGQPRKQKETLHGRHASGDRRLV